LCRPPRSRALSSAHPAPTATYTLSLHDALPILADAETLPLETVFLNPAVGHAQRQLVLVADPVASAEAVIAPQRSVVEAVFAGIEHRDVLLIFFRHIQVEGSRFEGLAEVLAEPLGVTVEVQAAVQAEDRNAAIRGVVEGSFRDASLFRIQSLAVQFEVVLGIGVFQARFDVAPGSFQRQANA